MTLPSIQIAVAAHKAYRMPEGDIYLPMQVGAAINPDVDLGFAKDDNGDNISSKNGAYCELTAMYWLWRNSDADYKGLVHYRRHFRTADAKRARSADRFGRIATEGDVRAAIEGSGVLLPRKRRYCIETVESHWNHTQPAEQLEVAKRVLAERDPDCLEAFRRTLSKTGAHMFNMCVMRADLFDSYCGWLFPLLEEMEARLGPRPYSDFQRRWPGRVSELLLDPWLEVRGLGCAELPVVSTEPVDWPRKASGFLKAKFLGKKYERSF